LTPLFVILKSTAKPAPPIDQPDPQHTDRNKQEASGSGK